MLDVSAAIVFSSVFVGRETDLRERYPHIVSVFEEDGVRMLFADSIEEAATHSYLSDREQTLVVLLDAQAPNDPQTAIAITEQLQYLRNNVPHIGILVLSQNPPANLIVQAFRSGADDFLDMQIENEASILIALRRAATTYQKHIRRRDQANELRSIVEEFLRDLVKTERRTIDLEQKLAQKKDFQGIGLSALDVNREACIYVVGEDPAIGGELVDELEESGMVTFAFVTGEDAISQARKMVNRHEPIDLALVELELSGIDGIDTISGLRTVIPDLPAILITGSSDQDVALRAADIGVVGFLTKPINNIDVVVERVKENTQSTMLVIREQHYLRRIKERHEEVLLRYRKLATDIENMT